MKGRKKDKTCVGRWEREFLATLKKKRGPVAKSKIEEEYGEGTYEVVLVKQGEAQPAPGIRDDQRIKLQLNKKGRVRKPPKFG